MKIFLICILSIFLYKCGNNASKSTESTDNSKFGMKVQKNSTGILTIQANNGSDI